MLFCALHKSPVYKFFAQTPNLDYCSGVTSTTYKSRKLTRVGDNLYRSGEGIYYGRAYANGKQYKESLNTHDRKTADRELGVFLEKIEKKEEQAEDAVFGVFADEWLAVIKPRMKEKSYKRRLSSINQIKPHFKGKKLRDIKHAELTKWEASRGNVSARTFNLDRETLRLLFQYAVKPRHILSVNPIDKETMPKRKEKKAVVIPPTREQFAEILEAIKQNKFTRGALEYVELLACTGMRREEQNQLLWLEDVDFEKGRLRITGGEYGTKNHQQRYVPMTKRARAVLERLLDGRKLKDIPPNTRVFKQSSAYTAMMTACKAIGLHERAFTHHDLRHFFCSNAIEKGIDFATIANWLGHKDGGKLVAGTYGHLRQSHSTEMAKLLDD